MNACELLENRRLAGLAVIIQTPLSWQSAWGNQGTVYSLQSGNGWSGLKTCLPASK